MFKNYLTLAFKVLRRKPLYTFISLFGISFTLMILMLLTSLFDATLGANQPLTNRDRLVVAPALERIQIEPDTTLSVDTIAMNDGTIRYDSTYSYGENEVSNSNGPMGYKFVTGQLSTVEGYERMAVFSDGNHVDGYLDGRKFSFANYFVNADYWKVFDFNFLHGQRLEDVDDRQASKAVVITDKAARSYFGEVSEAIIGREMVLGEKTYTVRGIVARPLSDSPFFAGDVYQPITTSDPRALSSTELPGGFGVVFLVASPDKRAELIENISFFSENFDMSVDDYYNNLEVFSSTFLAGYAQGILQEKDARKAVRLLFVPVIVLILLFVALPLLNLVNLNISRVFERKAEIGVRKAFGADGKDILYQFIFENMVLTFIGGVIGMVLAVALINYVNNNDLLGITRLSYSAWVFLYFLIVIILFGFLSGILPAYRMSRANVAESLR